MVRLVNYVCYLLGIYMSMLPLYPCTNKSNTFLCIHLSNTSASSIFETVDMLLYKLKWGKEDGVHNARSTHGYSKTSIHPPVEELNLWCPLQWLSFALHQTIPLIYAFGRIDWVDQWPTHNTTQSTRYHNRQWIGSRWLFCISRQKLLAALVGHEVDCRTKGISHWSWVSMASRTEETCIHRCNEKPE